MIIYDKNKAEAPNNGNLDKEERLMDSFILYGIIDMLKEDINHQKEKIKDCEERIKKMAECDIPGIHNNSNSQKLLITIIPF